ncbi:MAG: hypothetical protein AAFV53_14585 [Myxococcota bacterium]
MSASVITQWVSVFRDSGRALEVRLAAASALLKMTDPDAISVTIDFLDEAPRRTRLGRAYRELLVTQGGPGEALCVLLWEPDPELRTSAARMIADQRERGAVSELCAVLKQEGLSVGFRLVLLETLRRLFEPGDSRPALAAVEQITDPNPRIREAAARVIRSARIDAVACTPRLLMVLTAARGPVRFEGTEILPTIAPATLCARYLLRVLDEEEDELLTWLARFELSRLPVQAVEAIRAA